MSATETVELVGVCHSTSDRFHAHHWIDGTTEAEVASPHPGQTGLGPDQ